MKACSTLFSLALVFPFLMMMMMMIQTTSGKSLINSTCADLAREDPNIDYAFCKSSLQAAPASHCATLQELGTISIRLVRYNITDTWCFIKQLKKNKTSDPYIRQCLNDCLQLFSDAIPSAKLASRYYAMKKFNDANTEISSIMDAASTCEEGFEEKRGVVSPLTERNHHTFQLSAMALTLIHIIETPSPPSV